MGKLLESLGYIDGYDIIAVGKIKVKKDEIFEDILKVDEKIKDETRDIVNNSAGRVFAIVKKGIIKGLYLFEVEDKNDEKHLKHVKTVYTDEVDEEVRKKYDEHILNMAKDYISELEYDKITLEDKVVQLDPKKSKKEITIALLGGAACGFVLGWVIFDDIVFGLLWAIIFAPIFSGIDVVVSNKRGRKKNNDK